VLEQLRPLTFIVGAVAAWSAGVLLLALAGLGGRVGPHPPDLALVPAVPELRSSAGSERLGPTSDYLAVGERPLFNPDRRPAPVALAGPEQRTPFEGVLTSVLLTDTVKLAIFSENNGQAARRVRLGDDIPGTGWRLVGLEPRRATLEGPDGQRVLDLRVFDGQGGAPPTAVSFTVVEDKPTDAAAAAAAAAPADANAMAPGQPAASASPTMVDQAGQMAADSQRNADERAQIEAIRARIEARRAQLREQARDNNVPITDR